MAIKHTIQIASIRISRNTEGKVRVTPYLSSNLSRPLVQNTRANFRQLHLIFMKPCGVPCNKSCTTLGHSISHTDFNHYNPVELLNSFMIFWFFLDMGHSSSQMNKSYNVTVYHLVLWRKLYCNKRLHARVYSSSIKLIHSVMPATREPTSNPYLGFPKALHGVPSHRPGDWYKAETVLYQDGNSCILTSFKR